MIGNIAYAFHFPASEIWEMELDELLFWQKQVERIFKSEEENK